MGHTNAARFPDSPTSPGPEPEGRARRYYPIQRGVFYSLRDAAKAIDLAEGKLRRAILLDLLPAMEVSDDRHYLLEGAALQEYVRSLRPREIAEFAPEEHILLEFVAFLVIPLVIVLILIFAKAPDPRTPNEPAPASAPAEAIFTD